MLSTATWTLALTMGLVPRSEPLTAAAVLESPMRHVRAADRLTEKRLRTGFEQSPTFAALLRRLEQSDLVIYVEAVSRLPGALDGRLIIQPPAHGVRYVRIQFTQRGNPSETIAVIGHELRHAVEVADATTVVDERGLAALYRRIGIDSGNNLFDTTEARETGRRVLRELAA